MRRPPIRKTIHTALITALTIAAALIWKDVVVSILERLVPPAEALFAEIVSAIIATFIVIIAIYLVYKTEDEVEDVFEGVDHLRHSLQNKHRNHSSHHPPHHLGG